MEGIPVIDISEISVEKVEVSSDVIAKTGKNIVRSLAKYGFIHVLHHGVSRV